LAIYACEQDGHDAGVYAGILQYLKARLAFGRGEHDGRTVVEKMKAIRTDDPLFGKGSVRLDGRVLHPAYLFEVKRPSESKATSTRSAPPFQARRRSDSGKRHDDQLGQPFFDRDHAQQVFARARRGQIGGSANDPGTLFAQRDCF
jgi:hypothetical protein